MDLFEPHIMVAIVKLQQIVAMAPFYTNKLKYYILKCLVIGSLFWNLIPEFTFFTTNLDNIKVCTSVLPTLCQLITSIFKVLYLSLRITAYFKFLDLYQTTIQRRKSLYSERCYTMTEMKITKFTKCFVISICMVIVVYLVPPVVYGIYLNFVTGEQNYLSPFKHVYLFPVSSISQYILVLILGGISTVTMGITYVSTDLSFFAYCLYTRGLFRDLQTMFDFDVTKDNLPQLKDAITFHVEIFHMINKLNDFFSPIIFAQFLDSSIIICTVIFQSTLDASDMDKFKYVSFVFFAIIQLLFYSVFGTIITVESSNIANTAYFSKWTDAELSNKKVIKQFIVMIIKKSQNEVELDGLKVFKCNLQTFLSIMDVSFSVLAVLQSMNT